MTGLCAQRTVERQIFRSRLNPDYSFAAQDCSAPLRLAVAAFPFSDEMTASGLRKAGACGNLAIERIAGKDFTSLAAIEAEATGGSNQPQEHESFPDYPGRRVAC
jgi:hypothetical protein